jgi:hypothetical protein
VRCNKRAARSRRESVFVCQRRHGQEIDSDLFHLRQVYYLEEVTAELRVVLELTPALQDIGSGDRLPSGGDDQLMISIDVKFARHTQAPQQAHP